ncbi:helix-turn-helix domain-containing protein, partial [Delftia acidovorans]
PETALAPSPAHNSPADTDLLRPLAQQVAELERKAITATLAANSGNKLATARQLGISRATLYDRMAVLELQG